MAGEDKQGSIPSDLAVRRGPPAAFRVREKGVGMYKVWCYEEQLSIPGNVYTERKEYWVQIIAIPEKWWSLKQWRMANKFLKSLDKV